MQLHLELWYTPQAFQAWFQNNMPGDFCIVMSFFLFLIFQRGHDFYEGVRAGKVEVREAELVDLSMLYVLFCH